MLTKNNLTTLLILGFGSLILSGCATTQKNLDNIQKNTPISFTLPVDYISAYAYTGDYYQKCFARSGSSYPMTVMNNGTPVTITNQTADTIVSKNLNRADQTATISIYHGSLLTQYITFSAAANNSTSVAHFYRKAPLMSSARYQRNQAQKVELLKQVILQKVSDCPK